MRLSGNISLDSGSSNLLSKARGIFCSTISSPTQSMTSARVTLTTFESAVFDRGAQNSLTDELVLTVCSIPRCVRDWQSQWHHSHRHAQRKNCRHKLYKMRNRRILTAQCRPLCPFRGIWVSKQVHARTFLLSTRSWKSDFGFSFSTLRLNR